MRVLFVAPYAPSRLRVRSYGFARHLARRHDVHVLGLCAGELDAGALRDIGELRRQGVAVTIIQEPRYRPYLRTLKSALAPHPRSAAVPLQVAYTASEALHAAIARELRARYYDVVHVEHVRGLGSLPPSLTMPVVWDAVDCVSLLYEESLRHPTTPMLRTVGWLEARRLRAFERQRVGQFSQVLVTSERDRQALLSLAGTCDGADLEGVEITVLPHGIDPHQRQPRDGPDGARQPETLIFSGRMDYHANVAGALTLARDIMPLVWRHHPQARLTIAGSNPPRAVRQLGHDARITVTGYVRDLNALVGAATIAASPLPYAVGIQNKVLEAMASGTPVVASVAAAGGLRAAPGSDLLVAGTSEEFANAVLRLLDDPETWNSVAEHGAAYVAERHNWETITDQLTSVYERALGARSCRQVAGAELAGVAASV
ncbi:MAG TPA: glycosyltransferase [Ktedonobacterales bacterium]|nr:glycosyltransferase [Ktedonobacterales bacterium]